MKNQIVTPPPQNERRTGLDLIRIFACLFVVVVHVACQGFYEFSNFWKICAKFDAAVRLCVPLFFILSGYLLFNGEDFQLGRFLKKRFARILLPFFAILVAYIFVRHWEIKEWLINCFTGKVEGHLWFIYALVGLYLTVPLFMPLFNNQNGLKIVCFYILLWLLSAVFYPYLKRYFEWYFNPFDQFNFHYFFGYLGFFFLGGLLRHIKTTPIWRWFCFAIYILASVLIYKFTKIYSYQLCLPNTLFVEYLSPLVVLQSIAFFLALKDIEFKNRFISFLAQHTYWMYLGHSVVMQKIQVLADIWVKENTLWNIIILSLSTFLISFLFSLPAFRVEQFVFKKLNFQ